MTITLTVAPTYIGNGMYVVGNWDGTFVDGSHVATSIFRVADSQQLTSGSAVVSAGNYWAARLGWQFNNTFIAAQGGAPLGDPVILQVDLFDPSWSLLETHQFTGYFHDPVSGLSTMLELLRTNPGGSGALTSDQQAELDEIKANTEGGSFKSPLIGVATSFAYGGNPINGGTAYDLTPPPALAVLGLTWEQVTTPAYVGGELGVITETKRRVIQVVVFHTLLGGAGFADQTFDSHGLTGTCWFDSPNPSGVTVFAWPGFQLNLSWLIVL